MLCNVKVFGIFLDTIINHFNCVFQCYFEILKRRDPAIIKCHTFILSIGLLKTLVEGEGIEPRSITILKIILGL